MQMSKLIAVYLEYCKSNQRRPKTLEAYHQGLTLFCSWMETEEGITEIEDVTELVIRRYLLDLQTRGKYTVASSVDYTGYKAFNKRKDYNKKLSNITINNYLRYINGFFHWLQDMEYIAKSPMKRIRMLPEERPPKEYLEDHEVKALIKVMNKSKFNEYRDLIVMMIMLDSGTRLGEALSLEMEQINLLEKSLHLPAEKTKGRKARTVFFSQKTELELRKWLMHKEKYCRCASNYAFPIRTNGKRMTDSQYEKNFRTYLERAGIQKRISPHTLRNNFAKRCLFSGMDIYTLSRILGHSSVKVTEKAYLDVKDAELKVKYLEHSPIQGIYQGKRW